MIEIDSHSWIVTHWDDFADLTVTCPTCDGTGHVDEVCPCCHQETGDTARCDDCNGAGTLELADYDTEQPRHRGPKYRAMLELYDDQRRRDRHALEAWRLGRGIDHGGPADNSFTLAAT